MNNELLGTQIAKYRKAAGITQEELGKAVGVSTQAVSRWECGGAPDVSLLPALADKLGVSIDALFGRGQEKSRDIYEMFGNWLLSLPLERRMEQVFRLVVSTQHYLLELGTSWGFTAEDIKRYTEAPAYTDDHDLMRAAYSLREGITLAVPGAECPFYLLMPEPPQGYESNLCTPEEYRALFEALGRPGAMEVLFYLHRRGYRFFTAYALAGHVGLEPREAEELLETLAGLDLLDTQTIETEKGVEPIYAYNTAHGFVPFLFLARWIIDPSRSWKGVWTNRDRDVLAAPDPQKKGAPDKG